MTRTIMLVDRFATLLLALLLLAGGALGLVWWDGRFLDLPARIDTSAIESVTTTAWWPWASAAIGVVLIVLGLRWILAHLVSRRVKSLRLPGSGQQGRFEVDGGNVAAAAADAFGDTMGVRSARGVIERDRGRLVVRLTATIEPEADLALLAQSADTVSAELRQTLQREDLRCRVELSVASRGRALPRLR